MRLGAAVYSRYKVYVGSTRSTVEVHLKVLVEMVRLRVTLGEGISISSTMFISVN